MLRGLRVGISIARECSVRVIVTALVLPSLSWVLTHVSSVGECLTTICSAADRGPPQSGLFYRRLILKCRRVSWWRSSRFAAPVATST